MARFTEPTVEQETEWDNWVTERPECVRVIAERFDPWSLYRLKSSGHRVIIYSFLEDGTVTVIVSGEYNHVLADRKVFGIDPDDLEPCELPGEDELTGSMMSNEDVHENIDLLRVAVRPDLWELNDDGKAVLKNVVCDTTIGMYTIH
jgi:hypothetical protein